MQLFYPLLILIVNIVSAHLNSNQWYWTCNEITETCDRSFTPTKPARGLQYESKESCALACDPFNTIWPLPSGPISSNKKLIGIHPSKIFVEVSEPVKETEQFVHNVTNIFINTLYSYCGSPCTVQSNNNVTIYIVSKSPSLNLGWGTDESYTLQISTKDDKITVQITSETPFGARHALETISQLVAPLVKVKNNTKEYGLLLLSGIQVKDEPVFPHRGLLLDTARNFMSIPTILRQIDGMAASKMNVLHWHAVDSQSFPIESISVPELSKYGAYSSEKTYKLDQIKKIVKYGLLRGVRVLLEMDAPSHAGFGWQWGPDQGLGELAVCVDKQPWKNFCIQPPCGQLNPANQKMYPILGKLYRDLISTVTNVESFHMGGDEVFIPCWNSSQEIVKYLKSKGKGVSTTDFLDFWGEFQAKATEQFDTQIGNNNTTIILWTSKLTEPEYILKYLDTKRYVIQTWVPSSNPLPQNLLNLGYKLIISTKDAWYLDHGFWGNTPYYQWRTVYNNRISGHPNVLGGEVCMWSEFVSEGTVDGRIWPRAAAAAERLWSDPSTNATLGVQQRFYRQIERLRLRKIAVSAIAPEFCALSVGECFDKY